MDKFKLSNKTSSVRTIIRFLAILAGCIPGFLVVEKGIVASFKAIGISDDVTFVLNRPIRTAVLNLWCFGVSKWTCYKLGLINTESKEKDKDAKPQTKAKVS